MTRTASPTPTRMDAPIPPNVLGDGASIVDPPAPLNSGNGTNPPSNRLFEFFKKAGRKGFWPMADQGIVSIGNFATGIFVARGLSNKDEYGLFMVAFEFMLFLNSLQFAVVTYPLTVKGAKTDDKSLRRLTTASMIFTLVLAIPVFVLTLIAALISSHVLPSTNAMGAVLSNAASGRFGLASVAVVALVLWQVQETLRRALWAHFRHAQACAGDAVSYIGQALGIFILYRMHAVTLGSIFATMTLTSALAAVVQALQVGLQRIAWKDIPGIAKDFWVTGRWVAVTNLSTLVMSVCGSWAMGFFHGMSEVAEFFALGYLLKLCNPVITSIGGLIMPAAAREMVRGGTKAALRASMHYIWFGIALLAPYLLFIFLLPTLTVKLFYGKDTHFLGHELALRGCVVGYAVVYLCTAASSFLNGLEKPRYSFYGQLVGSLGVVFIVLPLNIKYGLYGCVWGGIAQAVLQLGVLLYFARRAMHEPMPPPLPPPPNATIAPAI